jgi:hypothetical protein
LLDHNGKQCEIMDKEKEGLKILKENRVEQIELDKSVDAILIGWDPDFTLYKACMVLRYV